MANIPNLTLSKIAQIELDFLTAYSYEHRDLDDKTMLHQLIEYTLHDKVQWLIGREHVVNEAIHYYSNMHKPK